MPPKVGKSKKKNTAYLQGVYERLGEKGQSKYRWQQKQSYRIPAVSKGDPLGQKK